MAPLSVSSPTAAVMPLERLHGLCDAVATPRLPGGWAARDALPLTLSAPSEWLAESGLRAVTISMDGQEHPVRGGSVPEAAA
jgi:hypothetical protein